MHNLAKGLPRWGQKGASNLYNRDCGDRNAKLQFPRQRIQKKRHKGENEDYKVQKKGHDHSRPHQPPGSSQALTPNFNERQNRTLRSTLLGGGHSYWGGTKKERNHLEKHSVRGSFRSEGEYAVVFYKNKGEGKRRAALRHRRSAENRQKCRPGTNVADEKRVQKLLGEKHLERGGEKKAAGRKRRRYENSCRR